MTPRLPFLAAACALIFATPLSAWSAGESPAASAASSAAASGSSVEGDAFVACESAVGDSLRDLRGHGVQGLQFAGGARVATTDGPRVDVKGGGRYRRGEGATIEFRYSCAYDSTTGKTSGVLLHEAEPGGATALPVWKADLSRLSPEGCESAVASRLVAANARASGIVFDSGSRQLAPGAEGRTALVGTGRLARAAGLPTSPFHYRCEFDAAGRLVTATAVADGAHPDAAND